MDHPQNQHPSVRDAYEVLQVRPDASQVVIQAAFRALAAVYHPDSSAGSTRRMAELNDAYARVRTADRRAVYDRTGHRPPAAEPTVVAAAPRKANAPKGVMDFGRYEGWSIADLARHDPDYLLWLRRHSSGIRFRAEIDAVLAPAPKARPPNRNAKRKG